MTNPTILRETANDALQSISGEYLRHIHEGAEAHELTLAVIATRGGSILRESKPGTAKTLSTEVLGTAIGGTFGRVQGSYDKTASDIVGSSIAEKDEHGKETFRFLPGPVFSNMLLVDEVSRFSPKARDGMLQALAEGTVTDETNNTVYQLPRVRTVFATRNPLGGDRDDLDLATLDRFMVSSPMHKPNGADRLEILSKVFEDKEPPQQVVDLSEMHNIYAGVEAVTIPSEAKIYVVNIMEALDRNDRIDMAKSTVDYSSRPDIHMLRMARAIALIRGSGSIAIEHIDAVAAPVLRHRIGLTRGARIDQQVTPEEVIADSVNAAKVA